jgi:uncharacterized protein (TIGR00730 family)
MKRRRTRPINDDRLADTLTAIEIFQETLSGMAFMRGFAPAVTVFGSARFARTHPYYRLARATGVAFARAGYAVITGGGPGIMEAANRGAKEVGGRSIGCNIKLPHEQKPNRYVDAYFEFRHFHVRKHMLRKVASAIILMPGGFGTLDEIFEALTLMQTGKLTQVPVIAMGNDFWLHLRDFIQKAMLESGTIAGEDQFLYTITDDPAEAVAIVRAVRRARGKRGAARRVIRRHRVSKGLPV